MDDQLKQAILATVKIDKQITTTDYDQLLNSFIEQASDNVCMYIGEQSLPTILKTVVVQITEAHFVKSSNDADGLKSYSEEGATWSFSISELDPFITMLEKYIDGRDNVNHRGGVLSW